ncbi:MAG: hypothetical protein C0502_07380 [Opitutus sp.]|nr:hypothetical protein [Opitutus sp.]
MDESLQDLENELKALRPRRPPVLLRARVERDLAAATGSAPTEAPASAVVPARRYVTATTLRSWKWVSWQTAAAAAIALAVCLGVWRWQSRPVPQVAATEFAAALRPTEPQTIAPLPVPVAGERLLAAGQPRDAYRPVKAANVLYDLQDEGPVLLEDNTPARRVRARYVDTYTWKNPATNASLKWSVPRDEVRVLPASFH